MSLPFNLLSSTTFKLPREPLVIALVGCGGTGSHLALHLVKLVVFARDIGLPLITLVFIDGDTVEPKNTRGRQLFGPGDVGHNKAEVLAARFNANFGLRIVAVPEMATRHVLASFAPRAGTTGILVGAVDRPSGRRALHAALRQQSWRIWLDSGNGVSSGQVCFGTATHSKQLQAAVPFPGMCAELPAPSLLYPKLLTEGEETPQLDCAARIDLGEQSLLINVQMAGIMAAYLYALVIDRQIDYFCTTVAMNPPMAVTRMISVDELAGIARLDAAVIQGAALRRYTIPREAHQRALRRRMHRRWNKRSRSRIPA